MEAVQCKKCRYLLKDKDGYNWCPNKTFVDDPDIDLIRNCEWYAVKTNADRIRSMTDEELAEWVQNTTGCPTWVDKNYKCPDMYQQKKKGCSECWLAWLRQEAT